VSQDREVPNREERVALTREVLLTQEGLAKLEAELERLATVERAAVTARLKQAVESDGDLAGNSDYLDAKAEQALSRRESLSWQSVWLVDA
jgi:transcription elongation factor GreA